MTPHVIVIGGGFAGLRAAVTLADSKVRVTVLESRASLGGRARSFLDPATGQIIDNGQHLFLAGYHETVEFLKRLGTDQYLIFQDRLQVAFVEPGGSVRILDCPKAPAPLHLLLGIARFSSLSGRDKLSFFRVLRAVAAKTSPEELDTQTVEEWLTQCGQSAQSRSAFWTPLAIATLNEDPTRASAVGFVSVLQTLLLAPWSDARLGMACVGLSELYGAAAKGVVEQEGGQVLLNRPVAEIQIQGSRATGVRLADGSCLEADAVVSAVPHRFCLGFFRPPI